MAYHESFTTKVTKLVKNPKKNIGKIWPFLKSKIEPHKRDLFEFFGNKTLSKPYPGHEKLLKYIVKKDGIFAVCGGNDGYFQDPTYYLEKFMGWKGIIAEPLPIGELCKKNRDKSTVYRVALIPFGYKGDSIEFIDCNAMSFIKGSIDNEEDWIKQGQEAQKIEARKLIVPARTLQSLIDERGPKNMFQGKIDLLVADVEGYELEVLKGLDFDKNAPEFILVEAHSKKRLDELKQFLLPKRYVFTEEIGHKDYLFRLNA